MLLLIIILIICIVGYFFLKGMGSKSPSGKMQATQSYQTSVVVNNSSVKYIRAAEGTYDKSYFINPETGKFRFPNYNADGQFIVKIKDETNYRDLYWDGRSQKEKQSFSIKDFEYFYMPPDLYIESFWDIFDKATSEHLKPYQFLHRHGEDLRLVVEELEDNAQFFKGDGLIDKFIKNCLAIPYEFKSELEIRDYYMEYVRSLSATDLKEICRKVGLKTSLKKQELVDQILENNLPVDVPTPYILNDSFRMMMRHFCNLYVEDIKKRLDAWHPLYIKDVWEEVKLQAEYTEIEKLVDEIITTKYWANRLREDIL